MLELSFFFFGTLKLMMETLKPLDSTRPLMKWAEGNFNAEVWLAK